MKSKVRQELWLYNTTEGDISISDLGVKVLAGSSTNVYKANPYLTEEQVNKSLKYGVLCNKIESGTLKMVNKRVNTGKEVVSRIKQSDTPIKATKTRSGVVIEPETTEEIQDRSGFDFADYGIDEDIVSKVAENKAVVIKAKEDPVVVEKAQVNMLEQPSNPMGKLAELKTVPNSSAIVVDDTIKQDKPKPKKVKAAKEPVKVTRTETPEPDIVAEEVKTSETKVVKSGEGVVVEQVKSDLDFLDSLAPKKEPESGMRVATRNKSGVIVMKTEE